MPQGDERHCSKLHTCALSDFALRTCKAEILIRTNCASFYPGVEQRAFLGLRTWSGLAAPAGRPGIADQMILTHVMHDLLERAAAVTRGIFDLCADLQNRKLNAVDAKWVQAAVMFA